MQQHDSICIARPEKANANIKNQLDKKRFSNRRKKSVFLFARVTRLCTEFFRGIARAYLHESGVGDGGWMREREERK